jgi:biopolymer transport protein ExbB/TolQ
LASAGAKEKTLLRREIMKQKTYQVAFPATLVVVMVAFLSIIFLANANSSFAATGKKKSPAAAVTSAVDHTEARIKQLKSALTITEDQEELWTSFTQVMRENAKDMDALTDALTKERAESTKTMNAVEHMKFHSQITAAHSDQMEKLIPPFEAFYSSMSDQQKNITNIIFRTGKYGKQKRPNKK